MTDNLVSFKCPSCDTSLLFDPESGKFLCPACSNRYELSEIENATSAGAKAFDWGEHIASAGPAEDLTGTVTYVCKYCAAEITADATTSATHCPYCDNEVIIEPKIEGALRPNYIIPFAFDKKEIKNIFKELCKKKKQLPRNFITDVVIEKTQGVYVPFWLYNCCADGTVTFETTKTRRWADASYTYTEVSYFYVTVDGSVYFSKIPIDASVKMNNDTMDKLEPYDYSKMENFAPGYLSGFLADRYDDNAVDCIPRADSRIKTTVTDTFRSSVNGYGSVKLSATNMNLKNTSVNYALLPVYIMKAKFHDKEYVYYINGQTRKVVGDFPKSKGRYWLYLGRIFAVIAVVLLILRFLIN
ncbi:MAG: hypothetical protein ILO53_04130 [Clostridia bacterium]|nr:hypothetical protein [Clostridia bacterium]